MKRNKHLNRSDTLTVCDRDAFLQWYGDNNLLTNWLPSDNDLAQISGLPV